MRREGKYGQDLDKAYPSRTGTLCWPLGRTPTMTVDDLNTQGALEAFLKIKRGGEAVCNGPFTSLSLNTQISRHSGVQCWLACPLPAAKEMQHNTEPFSP